MRTKIPNAKGKPKPSQWRPLKQAKKAQKAVPSRLREEKLPLVILFYKPFAVLSQFTPEEGKKTLAAFKFPPGVYPVGRLDYDSEGLLVLTNDNELKHKLTDPKFEHPRTYLVQVERVPDEQALTALRRGVVIGTDRTKPARVHVVQDEPNLPPREKPIRFRLNVPTAWIELTLTEGKNRQVRRMTAAVGHPTLRLVRIKVGDWEIGKLKPGEWKFVTK